MSVLDRIRAVPGWVDARLAPLRATLPWRAYTRYGLVRGNVLAGGIAYFAFFSIFPAMALGFTAFALVLGRQEDLQVQVVQFVNSNLGATIIGYRQGQGLVNLDQLVQPGLLTTTGVIGLVTLVLTGLGWIAALRDGVQAVFAVRDETNFVVVKLVDLLLLGAAGIAVLVSVVAGLGVDVAIGRVLDALGVEPGPVASWSVNVVSQLTLVLLDTAIFTFLFRRLAGVHVPLGDAAVGALLAALGFTALKIFAAELLQASSHNRFLAASGILIGLLVWMNLVARLTLVAAALSATIATDRGHLPPGNLPPGNLPPGPAAPASPDPEPAAPGSPDPDQTAPGAPRRGGGRALLAVGFVLGATAVRLAALLTARLRHRTRD
jgi:membrane protein